MGRPLKSRILMYLDDTDKAMNISRIADVLAVPSHVLAPEISALTRDGRITRVQDGVFRREVYKLNREWRPGRE